MASRISWLKPDTGLGPTDIGDLMFQPGGLEIANSLFWGNGVQTGTLRYQDAATGTWVTETTWMVHSGLTGTGTPGEVFNRGMADFSAFPSFDASLAFTGILGGAVEGGVVHGYTRLFGLDMPQLDWDNSAENADEATARAEFAANAAAAAADYLARITAILDTPIRGNIESFNGGLEMQFRPDANTTATYADFLGLFQDAEGRTYLVGGATNGYNEPVAAFGPDERVDIVLTAFQDIIFAETYSAGTLSINAAGGNDTLELFYVEYNDVELPDLLILRGGGGDDLLYTGAFFDSQIDGGTGNDLIDLTFGGTTTTTAAHVLSGGAGRDTIVGGEIGTNLIFGGYGQDGLSGGSGNDTIHGGDHRDILNALGGDDLLYGDAGIDTLVGGAGDDTLDGGTGNDVLDGDAGVDVFHFGASCGKDLIASYELGEIIRIDGSFWSGSIASFIDLNVHVTSNGILTIRLSDTDNIRISNGGFVPSDLADAILFV